VRFEDGHFVLDIVKDAAGRWLYGVEEAGQ
jgi:hypothetical protein